jgi:hypothetical protein
MLRNVWDVEPRHTIPRAGPPKDNIIIDTFIVLDLSVLALPARVPMPRRSNENLYITVSA